MGNVSNCCLKEENVIEKFSSCGPNGDEFREAKKASPLRLAYVNGYPKRNHNFTFAPSVGTSNAVFSSSNQVPVGGLSLRPAMRYADENSHYMQCRGTYNLQPQCLAPPYVVTMEPSSSQSNLQHISEREPDDVESDPSLNPLKKPLFSSKSLLEIEISGRRRKNDFEHQFSRRYQPYAMRRYNSCSTILLDDSTLSKPHTKHIVRALATAIYSQILNRDRNKTMQLHADSPAIFDETIHSFPKETLPDNYINIDPDSRVVLRFIRNLFMNAQLSAECAVVAMVYLDRLLSSAEIELYPGNWKRILLCCILLASKVWDDQAVWNVDYCQILQNLNIDDVNELERETLEIIQFNINVPPSVYAKYYFYIRALCDGNQPYPLSRDRAYKLEAIQRNMDDPYRDITSAVHRPPRWGSIDTMCRINRFKPAFLPE